MKEHYRGSGAALAVTLFMLGLLTIMGVSAIMLGTTHLRQVGNLQAETETKMALDSTVLAYLSDQANFRVLSDPACLPVSVNGHTVNVDIGMPRCVALLSPAGGSTENANTSVFEICARAWDSIMGTNLVMRWGVSVPFAECPLAPGGDPCPSISSSCP